MSAAAVCVPSPKSGAESIPLLVALYEPEIPANSGAVARLCAATGTPLHLIGRLGFSFRHPDARRAGMDYWDRVELFRHIAWKDFRETLGPRRVWAFTTKAERTIWDASFDQDDVLLFGPESRGLPERLLDPVIVNPVRVPMAGEIRSLNLATAVGVGLYEALRQTGWHGR